MADEKNFGYLNGEFINLYGDENPILEIDDKCYFLLSNMIDYHRPLICTGVIQTYKITEGQNRVYYIELVSILESPRIIKKFTNNKAFGIIPYGKSSRDNYPRLYTKKILCQNEKYLYGRVFPVEAFFVRESEQKILNLLKEYTRIILKDLKSQVADINELHDNFYSDDSDDNSIGMIIDL